METATTAESRNIPTFEEFMASMEALGKKQEETALQMQETDRRMQETDRRMQETDRLIKELRESSKDTDRQIKKVSKQMGGLNNSFGKLAEHLVAPGIVKRFNEMGYTFDAIAAHGCRIFDEKGKVKAEIDLLLENSEYIVAVEVKSKPAAQHIEHHVRRLQILREHRDKHHDRRKVRGAIAGAVFMPGVKEEVIEAGFYVIEQSGDTMRIDVPEGFVPREW